MTSDARALDEAIAFIRAAFPWWNQTGGARHFVIHTGARGRLDMSSFAGAHEQQCRGQAGQVAAELH